MQGGLGGVPTTAGLGTDSGHSAKAREATALDVELHVYDLLQSEERTHCRTGAWPPAGPRRVTEGARGGPAAQSPVAPAPTSQD